MRITGQGGVKQINDITGGIVCESDKELVDLINSLNELVVWYRSDILRGDRSHDPAIDKSLSDLNSSINNALLVHGW